MVGHTWSKGHIEVNHFGLSVATPNPSAAGWSVDHINHANKAKAKQRTQKPCEHGKGKVKDTETLWTRQGHRNPVNTARTQPNPKIGKGTSR